MSEPKEFLVIHENRVEGAICVIGTGETEIDAWQSALDFANERQREGGCDELDLGLSGADKLDNHRRGGAIASVLAELAAMPDSRGRIHLYRRCSNFWKSPDEDESA